METPTHQQTAAEFTNHGIYDVPRFETGDHAGEPIMDRKHYVEMFIESQGD